MRPRSAARDRGDAAHACRKGKLTAAAADEAAAAHRAHRDDRRRHLRGARHRGDRRGPRVKRRLFADLERIVAQDAIVATNTSSLSVTALAAGLAHPSRVVGMHFFNPAPLMPLVEVVSGLATRAEVAEAIHATAAAWGKAPVHASSTPGLHRQPLRASVLRRSAAAARRARGRLCHDRRGDARGGRLSHGPVRAHGPDRPRRELSR
jgi:hypothetical protein